MLREIINIAYGILSLPIRIVRKIVERFQRWGWKRTLLVVSVAFVLVTVLMTLFVEATSQPTFCVTCHYMRPYFASWEESSHQGVACTMCHFPPGIKSALKQKFTASSMVVNYVTGIYKRSKPWAEVSDESCLRPGCHETRLLEGRVEFKEGIIFDHKPHLTEDRLGKTLRCTSCHSQIVQGEHISVTETTCFTCHFKGDASGELSRCTKCHDAPIASPTGASVKFDHVRIVEQGVSCLRCHGTMQVGTGEVRKERCSFCHADLGKINKFDDTPFVHRKHIAEHKVECQNCHQEILHRSVSRTDEVKPSCEDCHPGFHGVQVDLFTGTGGKGVEPHPSTMFQSGLNCRGCHIQASAADGFAEKGITYKASGVVCTPCHDPGYDRILEGWKRRNSERLMQIQRIEQTVAGAVKGVSVEHRAVADSLLEAARYNISMVDLGHGIHNIPYAEALLGTAYGQLQSAYQMARPGANPGSFEIGLPKSGADCMTCHYGVETMIVQRTTGSPFPHSPHVLQHGLACLKCHDNSKRHGSLALSRNECNSCHHKTDAGKSPDCQNCHSLQATLFKGDSTWGSDAFADAMSESGMECADCHLPQENAVKRSGGETCAECHDETYADLLIDWKDETTHGIAVVDSLLHICRNVQLPELTALRQETDRIRKDRSLGAHNHGLVVAILKRNRVRLETFIKEQGL
ncbi:MAG: hypothetical protein FJY67_02305 [Calditrichaeota bacterium]|nr:hypothetical protein [Calditrichota bacterium]